jgi:transposase
MIWAEMGNVDDFKHPDQIVAFAGYDPKVRKSGNKEVIGGPNKRGSKILRWVLGWTVQEAKCSNPVLGQYFDKKISNKHNMQGVCFKKLIRLSGVREKQ